MLFIFKRLALLLFLASTALAAEAPIQVFVDASEAPRRIFHTRVTIPASPGTQTFVYPKWIPGEHGPTGPIADLVGLRWSAGGKTLPWRRDTVDMYAFHVDVPEGAASVEASFDYVVPSEAAQEFSVGPSATEQLAVISWNQLLVYPQGRPASALTYVAHLRLPARWKFASALTVARESEADVEFKPESLVTLIDSPVIAGAHFRRIPLLEGSQPSHEIDLTADSEAALRMNDEQVRWYENLVEEAGALFGARPYRSYHFLLSLSNHLGQFGLEHEESNDDRAPETSVVDAELFRRMGDLLPHEFVHSWNGKYRRPADMVTPDFQQPIRTDLLWIYEGLTQYLGAVLAARSGLWTDQEFQENLAAAAAELAYRSGRKWRSLADTAISAQFLYYGKSDWANWRRDVDFYDEGMLIWLEADTVIRSRTNGKRSLDDFCRAFFGIKSTPPEVKPYTLDDILAALNAVAPYDWRAFFNSRVYAIADRPPMGGIEAAGWKLAYTNEVSEFLSSKEGSEQILDLAYSLGMKIRDEERGESYGTIVDVNPELPAAKAGLAPGMKLIAVNGRRWSAGLLRVALRTAKAHPEPIELLVENADFFKTYTINYSEGEKYPHLERNPQRRDMLESILKPRSTNHGVQASAEIDGAEEVAVLP